MMRMRMMAGCAQGRLGVVVARLLVVGVAAALLVPHEAEADFQDHITELAEIAEEHMRSKHSLFGDGFDLKAAFKLHDYNNDNHLDMKEASFFYEHDILTEKQLQEQLKAVFQVMDQDNDGLLSYKEFKRFYKNVVHNKPLMPELTDETPKDKKRRKSSKDGARNNQRQQQRTQGSRRRP